MNSSNFDKEFDLKNSIKQILVEDKELLERLSDD